MGKRFRFLIIGLSSLSIWYSWAQNPLEALPPITLEIRGPEAPEATQDVLQPENLLNLLKAFEPLEKQFDWTAGPSQKKPALVDSDEMGQSYQFHIVYNKKKTPRLSGPLQAFFFQPPPLWDHVQQQWNELVHGVSRSASTFFLRGEAFIQIQEQVHGTLGHSQVLRWDLSFKGSSLPITQVLPHAFLEFTLDPLGIPDDPTLWIRMESWVERGPLLPSLSDPSTQETLESLTEAWAQALQLSIVKRQAERIAPSESPRKE